MSTTLVNSSNWEAIPDNSTVPAGTSVYDTATLSKNEPETPTGTVTYSFFDNVTCAAPAASTQTVTLTSNGTVPDSNDTPALTTGSYAFQATYSGDFEYPGSTSPCEPFSVGASPPGSTTLTTTLVNSSTWATIPDSSTVPAGTSVYDTATLTPSASSPVPTGTVAYSFYDNGTCTSPPHATQTVTLNSNGTVPDSSDTAALAAGSYSYEAFYPGDSNYAGSTSPCEPFSVSPSPPGTTTLTTTLVNSSTWATIPDSSTVPAGTSVYDTATLTPSASSPVPTGTVAYSFYDNGTCTSPPHATQTVTLNSNGTVPDSSETAALAAGSYSYEAFYSGDSNYAGSTSPCEPFSVSSAPGTTTLSTTLVNSSTSATIPDSSTVPAGTIVYDTATLTPSASSPSPPER